VAHELAEAGAAYAGAGDVQKRRRAQEDTENPVDANGTADRQADQRAEEDS
jgi:hypothetical protein